MQGFAYSLIGQPRRPVIKCQFLAGTICCPSPIKCSLPHEEDIFDPLILCDFDSTPFARCLSMQGFAYSLIGQPRRPVIKCRFLAGTMCCPAPIKCSLPHEEDIFDPLILCDFDSTPFARCLSMQEFAYSLIGQPRSPVMKCRFFVETMCSPIPIKRRLPYEEDIFDPVKLCDFETSFSPLHFLMFAAV
ncbi:hypothetical protein AVEN_69720-1 [Araneus ventricosus]|uniref:Uncharacterized protein n=1 Tax=Araneus ventricosus TaxID=182803 RepID=A0A4Y2PSQ4_ARAVE|nr:hypothetical protein AVEN_69720-1 [Araneus ventricosus]